MLLFFKDDTKTPSRSAAGSFPGPDDRRPDGSRASFLTAVVLAVAFLFAACQSSDKPALVRTDEPGYTGLERCALCHTNLYGEWKRSLHSRAMGVPADSTVVGDFGDVRHSYGGVTSRMYRDGDTYYMETLGPDGEVRPYRVDYTIGVRQHQAYLTEFPDGRLQVLPLYHDGEKDTWVDAQEGGVVESADPAKPGDFYFWANRGRSWNYHCYDCHASRVEKHYDPKSDTYETTVGSLTIDCEACHGPGKIHDDTRETPGADLNMVDLERLTVDEQIEVCAQCHAAKEVISLGYAAGESFYDHYMLYLPDDETFHPDGQPKVYLYPAGLHLMSPCYADGDLVCTTCHDPHGSDYAVDLVADKRTTALCASCHEEITSNPTAHSHHKFGSEGNTCVGCHMPYHHVTGEKMTDHRIMSPSPRNSQLFGVPNSCNASGCHAEKSPGWASDYVDQWFPGFQDRETERVEPYALGKQGNPSAIGTLTERLSRSETLPVWKAVAATLIGQLQGESAVETLVAALNDPFPMVRLRSAIALGRIGDARAIPPLIRTLSDSTRVVRIYTAFALSDLGYLPPRGALKQAFELALVEYETMVNGVHRDDPGLLDGLGEIRERNGQYAEARALFDSVQNLDPTHPDTKEDLSRIESKASLFAALEPQLRSSVEATPNDFGARGRLGSFYLIHSRLEAAGLQLRGAAAQLESVAILLAEARVSAREGDVEGAIQSVVRSLKSRPRHRQAARDLAMLCLSEGSEIAKIDRGADRSGWDWFDIALDHAGSDRFAEARAAFLFGLEEEAMLMSADSADVQDLVGLTRAGATKLDEWAARVFDEGTEAYRSGDLTLAERRFHTCIDLSPGEPRGYLLLGLVMDEQKRNLEAKKWALEGSLLAPDLADGYSVLGAIDQNGGMLERAVLNYRTALSFNPADPGAALNLGHLYMMSGRADSAKAVLKRAVSSDPQNQAFRDMLREIESQS